MWIKRRASASYGKIPSYPQERQALKFTLQYSGPLPSNGTAQDKHHIRRVLHTQLAQLWTQEPSLNHSAPAEFRVGNIKGNRIEFDPADGFHQPGSFCAAGLGGFRFVPLVRHDANTACSLRILFLRPGSPGSLIHTGGDIDNRLKTLFDALRIPQNLTELAGATPGTPDELFHCLLEDDSLITAIAVDTERLLMPGIPSGHVTLYIETTLTEELF